MPAKRRRRRRLRQGNKGRGKSKRSRLSLRKAVVNDLRKLAVKFLPGLSKGKKYGWNAKNRNPKVTTAGKAKLGFDLLKAAVKDPLSLGTELLLSGQKIGTLLGTNYKMPLADPKLLDKSCKPISSQYGWGFLMGNPAGLRRRKR